MGLPQCGQSPALMPTLAATGCPQLGQVPVWTMGSFAAAALGLKHITNLRSFRRALAPGYPQPTPRRPKAIFSGHCLLRKSFRFVPIVFSGPIASEPKAWSKTRWDGLGQTTYNSHKSDSGEMRNQSGKVGTMCFRPSAVNHDRDIQQTTCPTCGMPVAAEAGTTSGTCPYCGEPIPPDSPDGFGNTDPSRDVRIL